MTDDLSMKYIIEHMTKRVSDGKQKSCRIHEVKLSIINP